MARPKRPTNRDVKVAAIGYALLLHDYQGLDWEEALAMLPAAIETFSGMNFAQLDVAVRIMLGEGVHSIAVATHVPDRTVSRWVGKGLFDKLRYNGQFHSTHDKPGDFRNGELPTREIVLDDENFD